VAVDGQHATDHASGSTPDVFGDVAVGHDAPSGDAFDGVEDRSRERFLLPRLEGRDQ